MKISEGSDVDLLVDFEPERSLLDKAGFTQDLPELERTLRSILNEME